MIASSIGSYRILEQLGAGGMGEVYRAHDPRLNRDVAFKVLPASFASDPDRLRRFTLEAQTAGGLNHPNVLTIYEIGSHDGRSTSRSTGHQSWMFSPPIAASSAPAVPGTDGSCMCRMR